MSIELLPATATASTVFRFVICTFLFSNWYSVTTFVRISSNSVLFLELYRKSFQLLGTAVWILTFLLIPPPSLFLVVQSDLHYLILHTNILDQTVFFILAKYRQRGRFQQMHKCSSAKYFTIKNYFFVLYNSFDTFNNIRLFTRSQDSLIRYRRWIKLVLIAKKYAHIPFSWLVSYMFFSIWVFFHEHSRITGLEGKGGGHFFNSSLPLPPASQILRH